MCNKARKVSWYLWCPRSKAYKRETVHQSKEAGKSKGQGTEVWNMDKLWPGHGQNRPKQSNCERCRQEDWADNKGPQNPSPWPWRIFATETLENVWHSSQKRRKKKLSASPSSDFVLVMLSKKRRRFGVQPPHLLIEEFKIHYSWFQMYFRMLVGHFEALFQMLALYLTSHTVAASAMSLLTWSNFP